MEELAVKIAELLDISVQGAIDLYPVIRSQFIWYSALGSVTNWTILLGIFSFVSVVVTFCIMENKYRYTWGDRETIKKEYASIDKLFKISILVLVSMVVIGIAIDFAIPFLAPDILMIKDLIG